MTINELLKKLNAIENKDIKIYIPKIYAGEILLLPLNTVFPFIEIETKKVKEKFTFLENQKTEIEKISFVILSDE